MVTVVGLPPLQLGHSPVLLLLPLLLFLTFPRRAPVTTRAHTYKKETRVRSPIALMARLVYNLMKMDDCHTLKLRSQTRHTHTKLSLFFSFLAPGSGTHTTAALFTISRPALSLLQVVHTHNPPRLVLLVLLVVLMARLLSFSDGASSSTAQGDRRCRRRQVQWEMDGRQAHGQRTGGYLVAKTCVTSSSS